jgi:hypothetical protein
MREGRASSGEAGATYRALCSVSTSLLRVRALLWARESTLAALRGPDAGSELPALVEELRVNRRAAMDTLMDAQDLVERLVDAAGASPSPDPFGATRRPVS